MFGPFRQRRKVITGMMLGAWLFAFSVGVVHACGWLESTAAPGDSVVVKANDRSTDANPADGCEQFCATDFPVVAKLPPIDDPSASQTLIVALRDVGITLALPPVLRLAPAAHPPPDVPPYLRFTHLRL